MKCVSDRLGHRQHAIDEHTDFVQIKAGRRCVLGEPAGRLVFEGERHIGERRRGDPPRQPRRRRETLDGLRMAATTTLV